MLRRLVVIVFGCFGHVPAFAFLSFLAVLATFKGLQFYHFRAIWPCAGGCICISSGYFGHVQAAVFELFLAGSAMLRRLHFS